MLTLWGCYLKVHPVANSSYSTALAYFLHQFFYIWMLKKCGVMFGSVHQMQPSYL